ncbi:MAG: hypothetical protein Q9180_001279 [Flavoplaca navasiana]
MSIISSLDLELLREMNEYSEPLSDDAPDILQSYIDNPPHQGPLSGFDYNHSVDDDISKIATVSLSDGDNNHEYITPQEIGNWPQRLLHVPSMTSYEWAPGNIYGNHIAPDYNAISYTWGRYDLLYMANAEQKVLRKTEPIKIAGIPWADDVPRIHPRHFSVDDFRNVILQTLKVSSSGQKTEFVWLDVACIDQRNGPQKMAEIGRQAKIFGGAKAVFVWLTRHRAERLEEVLAVLKECTDEIGKLGSPTIQHSLPMYTTGQEMAWLGKARNALDELFMDPWFTSLWTLQEAFLCPQAYLLPLEAFASGYTLAHLCEWCESLQKACNRIELTGQNHWERLETSSSEEIRIRRKYLVEVDTMVLHRSLGALASRNPIALYGAACYRKTRNDMDRVYAIEQVFGFHLGTSAPGAANRLIHPLTLQNELGTKVLEMYPVLSQLHVFTEPVELGRGWRISGSSRIPDLCLKTKLASILYTRTCRLSTETAGGMQWGYFDGMICPCEQLRKAWLLASSSVAQARPTTSVQQIALDVFLSRRKPEYQHLPSEKLGPDGLEPKNPAVWGFSRDIPPGREQHELAAWLTLRMGEMFPGMQLVVLHLGNFKDQEEAASPDVSNGPLYRVGLLLLESNLKGTPYWRRLGFCIWTAPEWEDELDAAQTKVTRILLVQDRQTLWQRGSGRFG